GGLLSAGLSLGSPTAAPLARWLITSYDWRTAMLVLGDLAWLVIIPSALLVREPPALSTAAVVPATAVAEGPELTVAQALRTPQFAAIALTFFACCAAHSGPIFHMVTYAIDHVVPAMAAATVPRARRGGRGVTGRQDHLRPRGRPRRREARAGRGARAAGGGREPVPLHARDRELLCARADVRVRLRRRDAALRDPRARILRGADHG